MGNEIVRCTKCHARLGAARTCESCGLPFCGMHLQSSSHKCGRTTAKPSLKGEVPSRTTRGRTFLAITLLLVALVATIGLLFSWPDNQQGPSSKTLKTLVLTFSVSTQSTIMLYDYNATGNPMQIWAGTTNGWIYSVTFCDLDSDKNPEIVASTGPYVTSAGQQIGICTLLVYHNTSGTYELVVNETGPGSTTFDIARARVIDYYGNGTNFLITVLARKFVIVRYVPGKGTVRLTLPYEPKPYGFDVGDVNNDGKPDIVYNRGLRLNVLENQGGGRYSSKPLPENASPFPVDEIRIGDVDGDGTNEIVAVGACTHASPFWIYKNIDGEYRPIFGNLTMPEADGGIQSVDIGDVDGDDMNEIVTAAPIGSVEPLARRLSVWKYRKRSGSFHILWEDKSILGSCVQGMRCLRIAPAERSDEAKIVGIHNGSLLIVDKEGPEYKSRIIDLFGYMGTLMPEGLDVWSQVVPINEPKEGLLLSTAVVLVSSGGETRESAADQAPFTASGLLP